MPAKPAGRRISAPRQCAASVQRQLKGWGRSRDFSAPYGSLLLCFLLCLLPSPESWHLLAGASNSSPNPAKCRCHAHCSLQALKAQKGDADSHFKKGSTFLPLFRLFKLLPLKSTFNNFRYQLLRVFFFKLMLVIA